MTVYYGVIRPRDAGDSIWTDEHEDLVGRIFPPTQVKQDPIDKDWVVITDGTHVDDDECINLFSPNDKYVHRTCIVELRACKCDIVLGCSCGAFELEQRYKRMAKK